MDMSLSHEEFIEFWDLVSFNDLLKCIKHISKLWKIVYGDQKLNI